MGFDPMRQRSRARVQLAGMAAQPSQRFGGGHGGRSFLAVHEAALGVEDRLQRVVHQGQGLGVGKLAQPIAGGVVSKTRGVPGSHKKCLFALS